MHFHKLYELPQRLSLDFHYKVILGSLVNIEKCVCDNHIYTCSRLRLGWKTLAYSSEVNGNEEMESGNMILPVINVISNLLV